MSSERRRPTMTGMRRFLGAAVLALACCQPATPVASSSPVATVTAAPSVENPSTTPSPSPAQGRVVTLLRASDDQVIPAVNGVPTVCDFRIRGTIFDYRSGVTYTIAPVAPIAGQHTYGASTNTDEAGQWTTPVISLSDGDWVLTVEGALSHPAQRIPIRVACPGGRPATPMPTLTPRPLSGAGAPNGLEMFALGPLRGQIAWVTRITARGVVSTAELWAVPLDGSRPRLAVRYRTLDANVVGTGPNVLRRELSPDGRRIALAVSTGASDDGAGLAIIDLEAGRLLRVIGGDHDRSRGPAWSPDGSLIAFERLPSIGLSSEIWIVAPDGTNARVVRGPSQGTTTPVFGWTADSKQIGYAPMNFEQTTYALTDLQGTITAQLPGCVRSSDPVDWRNAAIAYVAGVAACGPTADRTQVVVGVDLARPTRTVADVVVNPADNNVTGVLEPRWDPSGAERIVYLEDGTMRSFVIVDVSSATRVTREISSRVSKAEWLPDGSGVVTLEEHPSTAPLEVNVWNIDGTLRTDGLFVPRSGAPDSLIDLALRGY